uniref:(northern house mosquito) hypothetical protein n=1 Tax=Culex pipiens TaxID=7175 RepID=A0A8D8DGZ8_CULPI
MEHDTLRAQYYSMDANHLLDDELEHELTIREVNTAGVSRSQCIRMLREMLRTSFDVGQRVYKKSFRQSSAGDQYNAKLGPQYTPCIIVRKKGTSSYEVSDLNGKSLGVFSAADLKA